MRNGLSPKPPGGCHRSRGCSIRTEEVSGKFSTAIRVDVGNQRCMLATIASLIAEEGSTIKDVRS